MPDKPEDQGPVSGLTPHLAVKGAHDAIAFYKKAFGAKQMVLMPAQDGKRVMHAHLMINGGSLMLADWFPEFAGGAPAPTPAAVTLHLQVKNADKVWEKAVAAGAKVKMPLMDMFWGDRYGQLTDPFGHTWSIAMALKGKARKEAMSKAMPAPPEMKPAAKKAPAKAAAKKKT